MASARHALNGVSLAAAPAAISTKDRLHPSRPTYGRREERSNKPATQRAGTGRGLNRQKTPFSHEKRGLIGIIDDQAVRIEMAAVKLQNRFTLCRRLIRDWRNAR